jgi:ubiquinone/menaquinone biosynthesis C-methylase UbiE
MSDPRHAGYAYDQGWKDERARLAGIEALWDPGTTALLAAHGAVAGASVLEAGAGGGSVVEWLAEQVGPTGHVLAVDIDVRFVQPLRSETVEVLQADLVDDELPEAAFDVVHCRMVLEHLAERSRVLDRLVRALRPGGTLVVEDYDWTSFGFDSADESDDRVIDGILALMSATGYDREYGRRLVGALAVRGLDPVHGEGRSLVIDQTHPGFAFFRLSFEQIIPVAIDAGLVTVADAGVVGGRLGDGRRIMTPTLVAAIGRAPGT